MTKGRPSFSKGMLLGELLSAGKEELVERDLEEESHMDQSRREITHD